MNYNTIFVSSSFTLYKLLFVVFNESVSLFVSVYNSEGCNEFERRHQHSKLLLCHFCSFCGRKYRQRKTMLRHQKFECGKEPQFLCPYCPKRMAHKGNLKVHIKNIHSQFIKFWNTTLSISKI